jgi:hypothetical protein
MLMHVLVPKVFKLRSDAFHAHYYSNTATFRKCENVMAGLL